MVKSISDVCQLNLSPRTIGIDDAPFQTRPRIRGSEVHAVAIITSNDRFEGMLYIPAIHQDGLNAGQRLAETILTSKFHEQLHAVLLDGVTMGGLNVIDIAQLATDLQRPVVALMRTHPNLQRMLGAIQKLPEAQERAQRIRAAGPIYEVRGWVFQYRCPIPDGSVMSEKIGDVHQSVTPEIIATLLDRCTPAGGQKVPECLRIAHLIGAAIKTGQSSSSA